MKSGSLNLLEPSGPHGVCYGTPVPFPLSVSLDQCSILVCIHILPLPEGQTVEAREPSVGILGALGRQVLSLLVKGALYSCVYVTLFSVVHQETRLTASHYLVFLFF